MRPTFRAAMIYAAGVPVTLVLILADPAWWPVGPAYLGFVTLLCGMDVVFAPWARNLNVQWRWPQILYIGEDSELEVRLTLGDSRLSASFDVVCDLGELLAPPSSARVFVGKGQDAITSLKLSPLRRGNADIHRIWLRWSGPFGLFNRQAVYDLNASVAVLPNLNMVRQAALRFSARDALHGIKLQHQQGEGSEFNALREWVPGLDHRSIDWKQSARHRMLVCKEFDVERNHHIILAFDTGHLMSEPIDGIPRLDHAVNASLLLGWASIVNGDRVGLYAFDSRVRQFSKPLGGRHAFSNLQSEAAKLDYRYDETNFTLGLGELLGRLERRSLIIVQSDFVDTITAELMVENLQRLSNRHLVMFVSLRNIGLDRIAKARPDTMRDMVRSVVADDIDHERRVVFEKLRRLGVLCVETTSQTMGADLLNHYLDIKRQELI